MRTNVPVISYEPFERFIASLRADGLDKEADQLHWLIHKVSWTTGSELIGELGREINKLKQERGYKFSSSTRDDMGKALQMVARAWPKFAP